MFQGSWTCSECGAQITELPFEPSGDRPVFCKACHQKKRGDRDDRRGGGFGGERRQRQMFQGNWTCSGCGKEITELPFEPDGQKPIYCRDCFRSQKKDY